MKATALGNGGVYSSTFGPLSNYFSINLGVVQRASLNSCLMFGLSTTERAPGIETFSQTNGQGYLFAWEGGFGQADGIQNAISDYNGWGSFTNRNLFNQPEPKIGFYVLEGSFFGDFNLENNFLRGCLGTPTYGFASFWTSEWEFQDCALGAPIGFAMLRTLNDGFLFHFGGDRELSIIGDPTLRLQITAPPADLNAWNLSSSTE
jgi:hypothetical protein